MNNHKVPIVSMSIAIIVMVLMSITMARADNQQTTNTLQEHALISDSLEQYAAKCDLATGVTVPDFDCDAGTEVPISHFANGNCDRPNRLNRECDPGSRFQVLTNSPDAYVVAHCRKRGLAAGRFADIAVIQYNRNNGAACFYQALGDLPGQVKAPSKGQSAWHWYSPAATAGIRCGGCHDNGQFIRSPYMTQNMGSNTLPGAGDFSFNSSQPYYWVGADFASWRASMVEVAGNLCNGCHRMGVSNISGGDFGTALDFGIRATAMSEVRKNPHSPDSPIWMPPGQIFFSQTNADFAKAIHDCALASLQGGTLPANCTVTPFAWAFLADLFLEQTASPDPVLAGANLTYMLKVTNNQAQGNGPVDVIPANSNDPNSPGVTLIDTLPGGVTYISGVPSQGSCTEVGGVVTCQLGRLNSGASATVTIVVMINSSTANGTILANEAKVSSIVPDPELSNNTAQVNTTVINPADLVITKMDNPDPAVAGSNLTYTVGVTNNGPGNATGVIVTDTLPTGVTLVSATPSQGSCTMVICDLGNLANGANATITIIVAVNSSTPCGTTLTNTAEVTSNEPDPSPSNNTASADTAVICRADLSITKTDSPDPVNTGDNLSYMIGVTNNGPSDATGVTVIDNLPTGVTFVSATASQGSCMQASGTITCNLGSLASGATATITIVVIPTAGGTIINTASVAGNETDPNLTNNSASASTTVFLVVPIDIKPGRDPNSINLKSKGVIPVAILTTPTFDATSVDPLSVRFGPGGASEAHNRGHIKDVDGDGDLDLVLHFAVSQTGIAAGDIQACLTGITTGGVNITGCDAIRIVPP